MYFVFIIQSFLMLEQAVHILTNGLLYINHRGHYHCPCQCSHSMQVHICFSGSYRNATTPELVNHTCMIRLEKCSRSNPLHPSFLISSYLMSQIMQIPVIKLLFSCQHIRNVTFYVEKSKTQLMKQKIITNSSILVAFYSRFL
jgi:hypothetical protein